MTPDSTRPDPLLRVALDGSLHGFLCAITPAERWAAQVQRDGSRLADAAPAAFPGSCRNEVPVSVN